MERDGFMLQNSRGLWWNPVTYDNDGKVTASNITYGVSSQRWRRYDSEPKAREAALRLVKRLAKTKDDIQWNTVIELWFNHRIS